MKNQNQFFCIKCIPGVNITSFQFASMIEFHLKCECNGLACDYIADWNGRDLFWQTDWMDWSEKQEQSVMESLQFFAKRYLREQHLPDDNLTQYIIFDVIRTNQEA